jgi:hypothetical protein
VREFEERLAAEVGEEPEEQREAEAEDEARGDGEVKRGGFAAMDDVAGETAEAEREFSAEIEKSADKCQERGNDEECAAEFTQRIHQPKSMRGMRAKSKSDAQNRWLIKGRMVSFGSRLEAGATQWAGARELGLLNMY